MNSKHLFHIFVGLVILLMVSACKQAPLPEAETETDTETEIGTEPDALTRMLTLVGPEQEVAGKETRSLSWEGKDKTFLTSANQFSFGLYGRLAEEDKDFILSPLSLQYILGMLQEIADDQTSLEIRKALGIDYLSREDVGGYYHFVLESFPTIDHEISMSLSNAFLVDDAISILPDGQQQLAQKYKSVVEHVDFSKSKEVVDLVNAWCNQHTNGLIPRLLPDNKDLSQMIACLMNAFYFKGGWSEPFYQDLNTQRTFYPAKGGQKEMTFMCQKLSSPFFEDDACQAFTLPVGNYQSFRWTCVLPKGEKSLAETVQWLEGEGWDKIRGDKTKKNIELFLPKFNTESEEIQLIDPLTKMGVHRIFSADSRWSSLLETDVATPISILFQKAKFGIDEKGVEGAAATFAGTDGATDEQPTYLPMVVDHPFLYVLSEAKTGLILFIGQFCS